MAVHSFEAAVDLSSHQWHFVRLSEDFTVSTITNGNAQVPFGVLLNDPIAGEAAEVALPGEICFAEAGGSISFNNHCSVNNDGELIAAPFEAAIGTADLYVCALALEDASDGEKFKILVLSPVPGSTE